MAYNTGFNFLFFIGFIMYFATLIAALAGFGFTISIAPANPNDAMIDAVQYYNAPENKLYPCYTVQTVELETVNVCQTGAKTASIVISVK